MWALMDNRKPNIQSHFFYSRYLWYIALLSRHPWSLTYQLTKTYSLCNISASLSTEYVCVWLVLSQFTFYESVYLVLGVLGFQVSRFQAFFIHSLLSLLTGLYKVSALLNLPTASDVIIEWPIPSMFHQEISKIGATPGTERLWSLLNLFLSCSQR